jgi:hypothetical protein
MANNRRKQRNQITKETRDLMWKTLPTREGKTTGASQQELHYDRSPVTNANGSGLKEVETIDLQWKTLAGVYDCTVPLRSNPAFSFKLAFASHCQKLAFILCI